MKMRRTKSSIAFLGLLIAALLAACGATEETKLPEGAAPAATPVGMDTCANCHLGMVQEWLQTPHANMDKNNPNDLSFAGSPTLVELTVGACTKTCHNPDLDDDVVATFYDSDHLMPNVTGPVGGRPVVGCEACHGLGSNHSGSGPIGPSRLDPDPTFGGITPVSISGWVNTCTDCHELIDPADGSQAALATHMQGGAVPPNSDDSNVITDTHFATPGVFTGIAGTATSINKNIITGYAMNYASETACTDCHNPHKPNNIIREWAKSAHADIYTNYELDAATQDPLGYFSGAWAHYNWTTSSRVVCQRCHTTTGFAAYADALRTGNTTLATAIRKGTTAPLSPDVNFKPERLKCNGCHSDNRGTVRNPGPITANYDYSSGGTLYAKFSYKYPDLGNSNVCMACHTGRESGDTVKNINTGQAGTGTLNFGNTGLISTHYLTAGGQVFRVTGYEFDGRSYDNLTTYKHDKIGTSAIPNTGTSGPCIGCHMSRPSGNGNHIFLPVVRDPLAAPTAPNWGVNGIASQVCIKCHTESGTDGLLGLLRERKGEYIEALEAFKDQFNIGIGRDWYFFPANPYFFTTPTRTIPMTACDQNVPVRNWQTGGTTTGSGIYDPLTGTGCTFTSDGLGTAGTGKHNMGVALNFVLLEHDPGGYVHNRMYVKRLIYDSIDWLDDSIMNYSVGNTLQNLAGPPAYQTGAMAYLLVGGTPQPFDADERP